MKALIGKYYPNEQAAIEAYEKLPPQRQAKMVCVQVGTACILVSEEQARAAGFEDAEGNHE